MIKTILRYGLATMLLWPYDGRFANAGNLLSQAGRFLLKPCPAILAAERDVFSAVTAGGSVI